jgi:vancomycin permeability regulator SanA
MEKDTFPGISLYFAKGLSFFIGFFTFINIIGDFFSSNFNVNYWLIDFKPVNSTTGTIILFISSIFFLIYTFYSSPHKWFIFVFRFILLVLISVSLWNIWIFYYLRWQNIISGFLIPFSLLIFLILLIIFISLFIKITQLKKQTFIFTIVMVNIFMGFIFPLTQIYCFGKTDYRRKAPVAIVFGAKVHKNGNLSDALKDRVLTSIRIYQNGLVDYLIFTGGPGEGKIHETQAMKNFAIKNGIPKNRIILDKDGLNTQKSIKNTLKILKKYKFKTALAISHFYHLPRIKMEYLRHGFNIYTVPAKETYILTKMPFFIAREIAALLYYYIKPLKG